MDWGESFRKLRAPQRGEEKKDEAAVVALEEGMEFCVCARAEGFNDGGNGPGERIRHELANYF